MGWKRRLPKLLLLTIATVLALVAVEIGVRIHHDLTVEPLPDPESFTSYPYTDTSQTYESFRTLARMEYSSYLGYIPAAGHEATGYRTNGQHFRYDEELTRDKLPGEVRVFVTGGSTAWGATSGT